LRQIIDSWNILRIVDGSEVPSSDAGAMSVNDSDTEHTCNSGVNRRTTARTKNIPAIETDYSTQHTANCLVLVAFTRYDTTR